MNGIRIKPYIFFVFITTMIMFILNKFIVRPLIIECEIGGTVLILTNSVPNLFEAIIGTINVAGILSFIRHKYFQYHTIIKDQYIFSAAFILAAMFVITQELKIHNLGGQNIYDPYDLIASIIGLLGIYLVLLKFGLLMNDEEVTS